MKYEVVIPARNEENYLEETLKSIKRQTIPPSKVIVVDDGSTDDTFEIAQRYADIVLRRADRGYVAFGTIELPKVFNEGLYEVSEDADYVLINGADDILPSNYVEVLYGKMASNPLIAMMSGRTDDGESTNYSGLPPVEVGYLLALKFGEISQWCCGHRSRRGEQNRGLPRKSTQPINLYVVVENDGHARSHRGPSYGRVALNYFCCANLVYLELKSESSIY